MTSLFGNKQTTGFSTLGSATTAPSTGLFQPVKSNFGQASTTQFAFGASTASSSPSTFSFTGQQANSGLNQKPAFGLTNTTPTFGNTSKTTPFGSSSNSLTFGSPNNTPSFGSMNNAAVFGSTSNTLAFGSANTAPAFGNANTTPGFNSFTSTSFGALANPTQTMCNQSNISEDELFIESISQPSLCGDERDVIISRWNQLQAMWGNGCGLSSKGKSLYNSDNYLARFKSVSYNQIPTCDDSEGFVSLLIKRRYTAVLEEKIQIHEKLHQLLNNQAITIFIVDVRPAVKAFANPITPAQPKLGFGLQQPIAQTQPCASNVTSDLLCDVFIKVTETMPNGPQRVVPSSLLASFLRSEPLKSKLESELAVIDVVPQLCPNSKEINDYLSGPAPRGLDVELWERVKQQCPNPNNLVPVPVIGMSELKARISGQVEFAQSQLTTIRKEAETVSEMKTKVVTMSGKIDQLKRKERELSNRILKVMCRLEIIKKQGYSLSGDEEALKCSLDMLWNQLVGAYGVKSRLQEILSAPPTVTGGSSVSGGKLSSKLSYNHLNGESMDELKEYFSERQQSIKEMMTLIRENIACLNVIENAVV